MALTLGQNWKTSLFGIIVAVSAVFSTLEQLWPYVWSLDFVHMYDVIQANWTHILTGLGALGLGLSAKDAPPATPVP